MDQHIVHPFSGANSCMYTASLSLYIYSIYAECLASVVVLLGGVSSPYFKISFATV